MEHQSAVTYANGFAQVSMIDPFTSRPHGGEPDQAWMLVLTPAADDARGTVRKERKG